MVCIHKTMSFFYKLAGPIANYSCAGMFIQWDAVGKFLFAWLRSIAFR